MAKDGHVSMKANFESKPSTIRSANEAAYSTKGGSDKDEKSHGSRPSHINRPEVKSASVGKARL